MFKNMHHITHGGEELFHSFGERHAMFLTLLAWLLVFAVTMAALLTASAPF